MRWLKRILLLLMVLVLAAAGFMVWTVRRSFPQVDGDLTVAGLERPVTIHRDSWGVPHIFAETDHDLFFAQGFVHAQERFWQMDFWRHIGSGRLAEMFGESQLDTDVFLRSLGFVELAERELETMPAANRQVLEWYAEGVNAYIGDRQGARLSLEYAILGLQNSSYEVEPWDPVHTLTWAKLMSWDLSGNLGDEIDRAILAREIPSERLAELYPPYPEDRPVIVEGDLAAPSESNTTMPAGALPALRRTEEAVRRLNAVTGGGFDGIGSNSWVVDGTRTSTGAPILANDTHLAIQMPAIWFQNGLHCTHADCTYRATGLSFPGAPGVVVGHNGHHAWGVTTQAVDTQDLFIERVNPDNPLQYEVDGEWVDFEARTETFRVAGEEDRTLEVLSSRHGPLISGTLVDEGAFDGSPVAEIPEEYALALAWQTLEPSTLVEALLGMGRAQSLEEFREAVSKWDIAAQNVIYADVDGNIAYSSTGEIPVRNAGDGTVPVPGWTSEFDWAGVVPFEELPSIINPESGMIVTANNPVVRPGSLPHMGSTGNRGLRASRILTMLESSGFSLDAQEMRRFQTDTFDLLAAEMVPLLVEVDSDQPGALRVQELLRHWSTGTDPFSATGDSAGAAAWMATWRHILLRTFADELGEDHLPWGGDRWAQVVTNLVQLPANPWWDDTNTQEIEQRDEILAHAMNDAASELTARMGDNPGSWAWGRLHVAHFNNQSLGESGIGPVEWLFNRTASHRVGGSSTLVNAVGWETSVGYEVDWIPSFRMVIDLANFDRSTMLHSTGQSGHAFHHHYDDMIEPWVDGTQAPALWGRDDIEREAQATLTLFP